MNTFIRVAEIWLPTGDRSRLGLHAGLYGPLDGFRAVSERTTFGHDEGLPGRAWAAGHPLILREFADSYFRRTEAAHAAGLTCGVAMPVFAGEVLTAVVLFLCGDDREHVGAIELWGHDPAAAPDMALVDGYYGAAELFEWKSRHTRLGPGRGLPGTVWESGLPAVARGVFGERQLLRFDERREVGVNRGLGLPYPGPDGRFLAMTFMSALNTPIARRFEIWLPDRARDALVFGSGDCASGADLGAAYADTAIPRGEGAIGGAWRTGVPAIREDLTGEPAAAGLGAAGLGAMLAMPVMRDGRLKAVGAGYS